MRGGGAGLTRDHITTPYFGDVYQSGVEHGDVGGVLAQNNMSLPFQRALEGLGV